MKVICSDGIKIDYIDFKRNCARYRKPYKHLSDYVEVLLFVCVQKYAEFKELCFEGNPEFECVRPFGESLHSLAEIESLTIDYVKRQQKHDFSHHRMYKTALKLLISKKQKEIEDDQFLSECASFARVFHGVFYTDQRFYEPAMIDDRRHMTDVYGY